MKISKRFTAVAALAIIGSGAGFAVNTSGSEAAPTPPTAVGNDHVACDTFFGAGKFTTGAGIDLVGGKPTTLTLKGTLDGCVDTDNAAVHIAPSSIAETVAYSDNFATALATPQAVVASATIKWKFDKSSVKTDLKQTIITWTTQGAATQNLSLTGLGTCVDSGNPLAPNPKCFSEDTQAAGSMSIASGNAFTGGDGGASSSSVEVLSGSSLALIGQLLDEGVIKGINVGAGTFNIG